MGVAIGSPEYEKRWLQLKVDAIEEEVNKTCAAGGLTSKVDHSSLFKPAKKWVLALPPVPLRHGGGSNKDGCDTLEDV